MLWISPNIGAVTLPVRQVSTHKITYRTSARYAFTNVVLLLYALK